MSRLSLPVNSTTTNRTSFESPLLALNRSTTTQLSLPTDLLKLTRDLARAGYKESYITIDPNDPHFDYYRKPSEKAIQVHFGRTGGEKAVLIVQSELGPQGRSWTEYYFDRNKPNYFMVVTHHLDTLIPTVTYGKDMIYSVRGGNVYFQYNKAAAPFRLTGPTILS
jgi:hypothetical protein